MKICFWLISLFVTASAATSFASVGVDPLFALMQGDWTVTGIRSFTTSSRTETIHGTVHASIQAPANELISQSSITEDSIPSRSYTEGYWVRPTLDSHRYELGALTNSVPTNVGIFDGQALIVQEKFGNDYVVESRTDFSGIEVQFIEKVWISGVLNSETRLTYSRTPVIVRIAVPMSEMQ